MDEFDKILYYLKVERTAEGYIDDLFMNMIPKYNNITFINRYYYKDDIYLFEHIIIEDTIIISWNIYNTLIKKYKCTVDYIICLIEQKIIEYLNIYGIEVKVELPF